MRYFLVTLVLLAYPGLLFAVFWFPSSGPRQVLELSVAKNGSFTTSSTDHGYQRAIDSGVDAVVLQTPPYFFPEHSEAAVQAGCRGLGIRMCCTGGPQSTSGRERESREEEESGNV